MKLIGINLWEQLCMTNLPPEYAAMLLREKAVIDSLSATFPELFPNVELKIKACDEKQSAKIIPFPTKRTT